MQRILSYFNKDNDQLVGQATLNSLELSAAQTLWNINQNNPMFDCYPVLTPEQINYIQSITDQQVNILQYDYFIEAENI